VERDELISPRGKIAIIKGAIEGKIPDTEVERVISFCSLCGGCEYVCPNGIRTIDIVIEARKKWGVSKLKKLMVEGFTRGVFPAHLATALMAIIFPDKLPFKPAIRPFLSTTEEFRKGRGRGKVMLFVGCLTNRFFPSIAKAISDIVVEAGFDLYIPKSQICCGFPHLSIGDHDEFERIRKHNLKIINEISPDYVISPCPTGLNTLKRFYGLKNVMDLSVFVLENAKELDLKPQNIKTTWHDPCHLKKELHIWKEPRRVLSGLSQYVEMERADLCCGFGGSFSLSHPEISFALKREKKKYIKDSGAELLITECPGCIMFMGSFSPLKTLHLGEFLIRSLGNR